MRPDVIEILEKEVAYHRDEIARIQKAIAVLKGNDDSNFSESKRQRGPDRSRHWTKNIREIFTKYDNPLTVDEVRERLYEKGLPAKDKEHQSTVQNILARMNGGYLERVRPGVYQRKQYIKNNPPANSYQSSLQEGLEEGVATKNEQKLGR